MAALSPLSALPPAAPIQQLHHFAYKARDAEETRHFYEAGATDFVSKPINWPILGHRVLYVLRASDAIVRLRVADAHNRAVLAAIPDTFFRMNKDGVYLDYAPGHERVFHQRRAVAGSGDHADAAPVVQADCVGRHIGDVLPQDIAARMLAQVGAVLATQQVRSVEYALARGGASDHFEARSCPGT